MLEKKKLRDIAEDMSGIRPTERSLEGIVNFIEKAGDIHYEKQPRTFLGRLRELGYALNGVRPTQRSLRGIVNNIYENYEGGGGTTKIYGVSGLYDENSALTRTDNAKRMGYTINQDGTISSDFDNVFPFNEMERVEIENANGVKNVFVKIPSMWFRVGADEEQNLTDIAVSKEKGKKGNWYQTKEFYYGVYNGSGDVVNGGYIYSQTNKSVLSNVVPTYFRPNAMRNGANYQMLDLYHKTIMNFLFWIEFANKNSQQLFGMSLGTKQKSGGTDIITTPSGVLENGRLKWHYIEDFFGNVYEFLDGVYCSYYNYEGKYNAVADVSNIGREFTTFSFENELSYRPARISPSTTAYGLIKSLGWDENNPFLCMPKEMGINADYDSYFGDCAWIASGNNYAFITGSPAKTDMYLVEGITYITSANIGQSSSTNGGTRLLYCPNGV